jgi:serine/threonine-protein kinase
LVGETIGSYHIQAELGQGGMGTVYLAEHRHLHRKAAIKVLLKEFVARPDLLERFFAEARATSLIEHPAIVQIFDCEVDASGRPYIVMEYLGGETLAGELRRRGTLPPGEAAAYARCMAEGLAAAHDKGIIHRDIKPDNVFVKLGPPPSAKLVDFGIAKLAGEFHAGLRNRTQTGIVMGTPLYMSPEQCRGAGAVDHRTDIYSLGCVLFEMLAGRPPFQHEGPGELVAAHLTQPAPALHALAPAVPAPLDALVAAMLNKAAADRPQTMREVAARLADGAIGAAAGAPAASRPPAGRGAPVMTTLRATASEIQAADEDELRVPRRRGGLFVVAVVAALVAGGGWWGWRRMAPPARSPQPAPLAEAPPAGDPAPSAAAPLPAPSRPAAPVSAAAAPANPPRVRPPRGRAAALSPPAARAPVSIELRSEPPGANLCFEGDRRLIGTTPQVLSVPGDGRRLKLLLQLAGYRVKQVTVKAERDLQRSVALEPLGTDDLAPVNACR